MVVRAASARRADHPKHFTAELAKIAKVHQVSPTWAQRLGQNVPVCATFFLPPFLWIWGISLRAWRALRFKCTFWDHALVRPRWVRTRGRQSIRRAGESSAGGRSGVAGEFAC